MSLLIPERTRYDVNFRLLGFPVRVHPAFWGVHLGIAGFLALDPEAPGPVPPALVFVLSFVCTAGSVLLHELGHVLAGRRFGADGEVVLTFLGGFAATGIEAHSRKHRILTTLAGPAVNLVLAAVGTIGWECSLPSSDEVSNFYLANPDASYPEPGFGLALLQLGSLMLMCVNIPLFVFNMIPIPPLGGGQVLREVVEWYRFGDRPDWERDTDWWKRRG